MTQQFTASEVRERERFEEWYTTHAYNYSRDPIGSRDCSLQWEAWKAALAAAPQSQAAEPVAWRTFDGEGGYDYRSYEDNETYRDDYIKRNGPKYPNWVQPLYLHPQPLDQDAKDAARYRWLRDHSGRSGQPYIRCDDAPFESMDYWVTAGTADACIDRAMAKESGR